MRAPEKITQSGPFDVKFAAVVCYETITAHINFEKLWN